MGKKIKYTIRLLISKSWSKTFGSSKKSAPAGLNETSPLLPSSSVPVDSSQPPPSTRISPLKYQRASISQVITLQSSLNLIEYTIISCHLITYDQLLPIFMHNPPAKPSLAVDSLSLKFTGGFGLDSSSIGTIYTLQAILTCIGQFLIYPPTAKRYGVLKCLKACVMIFPIIYFITPFTALVPSGIYQQTIMFIILLVKNLGFLISFPSSMILLTNSARSVAVLGTLNGLAGMILFVVSFRVFNFLCG